MSATAATNNKKSLLPIVAAASGGYFTSSGKAVAVVADALPPLVTVTPLPEADGAAAPTTVLTSQELDDLDEMVDLAAVIASVPVPVPDPTAAKAATWLTPFDSRVYRIKAKSEGIWIHGEASSAFDPGFRAIVCLDARPTWFPQFLGLPTDLESYRYLVFLQRTVGPNEMFGRWIEDEAKDAGELREGRSLIGRRTLRMHVHEYLSLLTLVREEWQAIETRLAATARQLGSKDQPVATDPGVSFVGESGVATFQARLKDRLFFEARLDSDHPVASNIWVRLDIRNNAAAAGSEFHRMEIPFAALVAVAIFFPSYAYAEAVLRALEQSGAVLRVALQPKLPDLAAQSAWVEESLKLADALFLVLGSSFAEGIDLLGGRVTHAMVVGPALPEVNAVQKARLAALAGLGREADFRRVYQIPGLQKVTQALGRLVRAPGQHAKVLLHCRRFAEPSYAGLLATDYQMFTEIAAEAELLNWLHQTKV